MHPREAYLDLSYLHPYNFFYKIFVKNFYTFNIFYKVFITVECLNLGLKGISMGPLYVLRGVGGHVLSTYQIPLGPIRVAQQRDDPRAAKRRRADPARAAGCDIYATVYPQCNSRAAAEDRARQAHNLCVYNAGAPATLCHMYANRGT